MKSVQLAAFVAQVGLLAYVTLPGCTSSTTAGNAGSGGDSQAGTGGSSQDAGGASAGGSSGVMTGGAGGTARDGGSAMGGAPADGGSVGTGGTSGAGDANVGTGGAGGASSLGGSGGGPVIVTKCDALGAVGTWQNVEPAAFHVPSNMQTIAVAVNPNDQSVFAAASNKTNGGNGSTGIYKSTDCGSTWKLWNTGMGKDALATGQLWALLIDLSAPENMYVANGYGSNLTLFKSTDGGVNFLPLQTDPSGKVGFVQAVALEPGNPRHVAVTYHENCNAPFNANCLSQSTDGGATWAVFSGPAAVNGWQEGSSLTVLGPSSYLYACSAGAFFTSNGGASWDKVIDKGIFGRYAGSTDIAPDGTMYLGVSNTGMYFSRADLAADPVVPLGKVWTLIPNSPQATNIIDDGVELIAAEQNGPPFYTAKVSASKTWTHMASPGVTSGSNEMAYDAAHHIVYSANFGNGLLRLVTR